VITDAAARLTLSSLETAAPDNPAQRFAVGPGEFDREASERVVPQDAVMVAYQKKNLALRRSPSERLEGQVGTLHSCLPIANPSSPGKMVARDSS
jgi:hypothetical protein